MTPTAMFTSKSTPDNQKFKKPYNPNAFCSQSSGVHAAESQYSGAPFQQYYTPAPSFYHPPEQFPPNQPANQQGLVPMPMFTPGQHQKLFQLLDQTSIPAHSGIANMACTSITPANDVMK
ncbi:hypothetical protein H5410_023003 [Solanum commersonii]|uniref:Uncharacterized protein n=1 Tax=Solanum commersonii TaxID=4109 RepID=A0A9J5ZGC1_SOLCO|nr:hypothetical protein H5410_023003 [Solanum commersonii]